MTILGNPRLRAFAAQALVVIGLALLLGFFAFNASANMQRHNLPLGLAFLSSTAGFDIPFTLIAWQPSDSFARAILVGLLNTLLVFLLATLLATVAGSLFGVMRLASNAMMRGTAAAYVEIVRNTPVLIQVILIYMVLVQNTPPPRQSVAIGSYIFLSTRGLVLPAFSVSIAGAVGGALVAAGIAMAIALFVIRRRPADRALRLILWGSPLALGVTGLGLFLPDVHVEAATRTTFGLKGGSTLTPELLALLAGLSIYFSAFIAEIVRAGLTSVPRGQIEAAEALALRPWQVLRLVTVPLAMRVIIPPLTSQYLNIAKGTSLGAAVAFPDLVQVLIGSILNRTGQAIESMGLAMAIFLLLSFLIATVMGWINRAGRLVTRQ